MVYGFVKQSGGHIKVYSEIDHGTTFKIYLPRTRQAETAVTERNSGPATGGSETVLVVEDDPAVRETAVEMLSSLGYKVLKADNGQSALSILQSGIPIDMLFSDVVMPGPVQSPELATQARAIVPGIAVLFTSGYTQNAIVHGGKLDEGVELISKPYRREDLARKVRQVLERSKHEAPVALRDHSAASSEKPESPACLRILVVEDDLDSQQMLCELLNVLGHQSMAASDAETALAALAEEAYDVLLTDVGLPGKSGIELAKEAMASFPSLQIIFCSGYGAIDNVNLEALSLPKPYTLDKIMNVLAMAARNQKLLPRL
jgi:CheY-like chemotaxis protein